MTTDEFLSAFGHLVAAPGGPDRIKQLVLTLAVTGRLVTQGEAVVSTGKAEMPQALATNEHRLPPGWVRTELGTLVQHVRESAKIEPGDSYELWSIPSFSAGAPERVTGSDIGSVKLVVAPGDVLISKINPRINRVWVVREPRNGLGQVASTEWIVARITDRDQVSPGFLALFATSPPFRRLIQEGTQSTTGSHTRAKARVVLGFPIAVPPLKEQERILSRVEDLMTLCDELEESQRQARAHRLAAARSALAAIVESDRRDAERAVRLVEEHVRQCLAPGDGALEVLGLVRGAILDLAVAGRLTNPGAEQSEWERTDLASIVSWAGGSAVPKSVQGSSTGEFLVCKVGDMNRPGNERYIRSTENRISAEVAEDIGARAHGPGAVIFPKIGGAIATNKRRLLVAPTVLDPNCLGVVPRDGVSSEWLFLLMSSIDMARLANSGPIPAVSQRVLGGVPVVLPPPADQERIVARVHALTALCDEIEANMMRERSLAGDLLQSACTAVVSA